MGRRALSRRWTGWGTALAVPALVVAVFTATLVGATTPAGAAESGSGQPPRPAVIAADVDPVSASEVIARATGWTNIDVPYSQTTWFQGYRTDCSGFVSMAWALTSGGQPLSLVTQTLPNVSTQIPFSQLMPGDALIFNSTADPRNGSHAEMFGGWVDNSQKYFYVYQESYGATVSIASFPPAPLDDTSQWYAYQDDGMVENLPAVPAVPPVVPDPPSGVRGSAATPTSITVSWGAAPSATQYDLYSNGVFVTTTSSDSATQTGLVPSTAYRYQVVAVNGLGPSRLSGTVTVSTTAGAVAVTARRAGGYWVTGSNGAIFGFGGAGTEGSMEGRPLVRPVVGMAATVDARGYWMVAADGGMFSFGDAQFYGSMGGIPLNKPIVGMAATPDGKGYWQVAADGGIFSFGDAQFYGSMGGIPLNKPIVGMTATPDGKGYWLVAADGGIFSFGDARFAGSTGALHLNRPIVGMASTPDGAGYWLVAADGGIFSFGDAPFLGSLGANRLTQPIVGMAATPQGTGYWLVAADGTVTAEGDAVYGGSAHGAL